MDDEQIAAEAVSWVKAHKDELISRFVPVKADAETGKSQLSIFMAGSPGAGKTEFSKSLIEVIQNERQVVRIDPDEIRIAIPGYIEGRAELFQSAVAVAVEKIHDVLLGRGISFVLDGTSANLVKLQGNIQRSLKKERLVFIEYVYQDPLIAWDFTQKRERVEGRNIPKESFVEQLFCAYENIQIIKDEFGEQIYLDFTRRNIETGEYIFKLDIQRIADHLIIPYTREELLIRL